MKTVHILYLLAQSVGQYGRLIVSNQLHLRRNRLGQSYEIEQKGTYQIFRETVTTSNLQDVPVVLIVGFHLKFIGSNRFMHWLFQRCCILTTPFWSGFKGFRVKLWMVDPKTKNYLGIYQWLGKENAQIYVDILVKILRLVSTKYSIWYSLYNKKLLECYLVEHSSDSQ